MVDDRKELSKVVVCNYLDISDYRDTYVKTYRDWDNLSR